MSWWLAFILIMITGIALVSFLTWIVVKVYNFKEKYDQHKLGE